MSQKGNQNENNSQRVGGGSSTQPAYVANNNTSRRVLTSLAEQGYGAGLLSTFPEMGHDVQFMSAVKNIKGNPLKPYYSGAGRTHTMHAAFIGDMKRLRELVKKFSADIHTEDNQGMTALAWAALAGRLKAVQFLVEHGAEINRGRIMKTPLYCAIQGNHLTTVRWLCDRGANVNGERNLEMACTDHASPEILELLCERGADVSANGAPLHRLTQSRRNAAEKVAILCRFNAPLEFTINDFTPLLRASYSNNVSVVRALCECGANKEARQASGMTPLMMACFGKISDGTVTALCEYGADKEARDPQGKTPLFYVLTNVEHGAIVLSELLAQDVNIEGRFMGKSTLDAAVESKVPILVKLLCEHARRKNIQLNIQANVRRVKMEIAGNEEQLQYADEEYNERGIWGNQNIDYNGERGKEGIQMLEETIRNLRAILKILEENSHPPKSYGSKQTTKKSAANNSNNWRSGGGGGGGGGGSKSTSWRGGSKRKTRRFKNRV